MSHPAASLRTSVTRSPDILGGTLVFKGTRVPVRNLQDYIAAGDSVRDFVRDYPTVTHEQAVAYLRYAFTTADDTSAAAEPSH